MDQRIQEFNDEVVSRLQDLEFHKMFDTTYRYNFLRDCANRKIGNVFSYQVVWDDRNNRTVDKEALEYHIDFHVYLNEGQEDPDIMETIMGPEGIDYSWFSIEKYPSPFTGDFASWVK